MIKILSAKSAIRHLENGSLKDFVLISIRDNKKSDVYDRIDMMQSRCGGMHTVVMSDVQFGETVSGGEIMPAIGLVRPALEFAKGHDNVAVHCTAGVSRSSAMAFLVELQRTGDADVAVKVLDHNIHYPNMSIVMIGEHILGIDCVETIMEFNMAAERAMFDTDNGKDK